MLLFNLTALSDAQIHKMIWARCKAFGRVEGVSIHRRSTTRPGAFALVDMAPPGQEVIKGIGDDVSSVIGADTTLAGRSARRRPRRRPLGGPYAANRPRTTGANSRSLMAGDEREYFSDASRAAAEQGAPQYSRSVHPSFNCARVERNYRESFSEIGAWLGSLG